MDEDKVDRSIDALERIAAQLAISNRMALLNHANPASAFYPLYQEFIDRIDALEPKS